MRWLFLIIFLFPAATSADEPDFEELKKYVITYMPCDFAFNLFLIAHDADRYRLQELINDADFSYEHQIKLIHAWNYAAGKRSQNSNVDSLLESLTDKEHAQFEKFTMDFIDQLQMSIYDPSYPREEARLLVSEWAELIVNCSQNFDFLGPYQIND